VLSANLDGRGLGAAVADIRALLAELPPPRGVSAELGGQSEEMQTSFVSLRFGLGLAVFLVYLVMAPVPIRRDRSDRSLGSGGTAWVTQTP